MASKEATIFVVDLSKSMGKLHHARDQSDLNWSLQYLWDKITDIVYQGRKTLYVGVIGLGTDQTSNFMTDQEGYEHISILQDLKPMFMPELQRLPPLFKPSHTDHRDAVSGIILAVHMINTHCRNLQYKKKLVLVTNATSYPMDPDDIPQIAEQVKQSDIELVVLGVDFDDAEYGFKEEDKSTTKAQNERLLKQLVEESGGMLGTMQEAIDGLARPNVKQTRSVPTYKGQLRLGDPEQYDTALTIDVERYAKVMVRRPPTASAYALKTGASQAMQTDNLTNVRNSFMYTIKDEEGVDKNVERDELAKGYEYGRTVVPISETDENITKLETTQSYDILGFIPTDNAS